MADATPTQDAELKAPELSNRLLLPTLHYFEEVGGIALVESALKDAGLPRSYLEDTTGWVSMEYLERLTVALIKHLGRGEVLPPYDDEVYRHWYELGRRLMQRDAIGPAWVALQAMGSPDALFQRFGAITGRGNRAIVIESRVLGQGLAEVTCRPVVPGRGWYIPSCWNFKAILETLPTIWGLPPGRVEHTRCMFDRTNPAEACVYRVRYENPRFARYRSAVVAGMLGFGLGAGAVAVAGHPQLVGLTGAAGAGAMLAAYFARRTAQAEARIMEDGTQLGKISDKLDQRYAELYDERRGLHQALLASQKLSGYLPSDLVEQIAADPARELKLGGSRTQAAVLFADLVGFTSRCERKPPESVVAELNRYFRHIDPAFERHGGVIDKRMGDGVMAVFVPKEGADAREVRRRAVRCAADLVRGLESCNQELALEGGEPLEVRIGVAAGPLVQGKMGSDVRYEYTVIGDVVNLAARLEAQARPGHVVVTSDVWNAFQGAPPDDVQLVGRQIISVKGKQQAVDVVELAVTGV
ncbi:MAG: adenylate/guanylate cyclase domain-containing protein [Myxococcota bacterium]|nr:adenylate/guanylate cyclase domain-containing protein [Myxococcota bacterium]